MMTGIIKCLKELGKLYLETEEKKLKVLRETEESRVQIFQLSHRENTEALIDQLEKLRSQPVQKLPFYDGENMSFHDWQNSLKSYREFNGWTFPQLINFLPLNLGGRAKLAFENVEEKDKRNEEKFCKAMRGKIDPTFSMRNHDLFLKARKHEGENMICFIDRCKNYVRQADHDPEDPLVSLILKRKVFHELQDTEKKILKIGIESSDDINKIAADADSLIRENGGKLQSSDEPGVGESLIQETQQKTTVLKYVPKSLIGPCGKCHNMGHLKKECLKKMV